MFAETYTLYLLQIDNQHQNTIKEHLQNLNYLSEWAKVRGIKQAAHLNHQDIYDFMQEQKAYRVNAQVIQQRFTSICKYYNFLVHIRYILNNPTQKITLRDNLRRYTKNLLSHQELEALNKQYLLQDADFKQPAGPYLKQRNNALAGLLIWQGAVCRELINLKPDHIQLEQGLIYMPQKAKGQTRVLRLHTSQVAQLYQYLYEARPKLIKSQRSTLQADGIAGGSLFKGDVYDQCAHLLHAFKAINKNIHSLSHLRSSIIFHWTKCYGKNTAQLMAGYKDLPAPKIL